MTSCFKETSTGLKGVISGRAESFSEKTSTVKLIRIFFFLASTDRLITLNEETAARSMPAREAAIFLIVVSSAAAEGVRLI